MPFPSTISTFPIVNPTDRLNSPSHSALHNSVSSVLTQVQTVIGVEGANSVVGTLEYLIKSPASNGGGHVQGAAFGGTGQTTFTKGDQLVATSSSVLSKVAIGLDGQAWVADSSVAAGAKWGAPALTKIYASVLSSIIGQGIVTETSILSITLPGSVLGTNNVVRTTVNAIFSDGDPLGSILVRANYGGAVASVLLQSTNQSGFPGSIEYRLFGNGAVNAQYGELTARFIKNSANMSSIIGTQAFDFGTSSVASGAPQTLGLTWRFSTADSANLLIPKGVVVERII